MAPLGTLSGRICGAAACLIAAAATVSPALAQGSGGSQDITRGLTDPRNGGVAGTGMGTADSPPRSSASGVGAGGAAGTGMSVKGPPGQGISGPETRGLGGGADATSGSGLGAGQTGTKPVGQ